MSNKKLGCFNDLINAFFFNPSYVCHDMNIFWSACFVKFPWHCWTEFSQSWKTLQSHENLQPFTNLSDARLVFIQIQENGCFECSWCQKSIHCKSVLFWKDVKTVFSIFIKISRNAIPKYDHIITPHVSSTSTFIRIVRCCADFIGVVLTSEMK